VPGTLRLLVSLAMYNEADNVRPLVLAIREVAPHSAILLIDDGSPDGTGAIADELARELPDITVVHRAGKQGLGSAIVLAMKHAIAGGYDYYLNLDADFSHPPRYIPDLLAGMADHDVMIGSRYVPGGKVSGEFGLRRKIMSAGINGLARVFLGLPTRDNSGSFRCYRVSKLAQLDLDGIRSRGYSFMEEILYLCRQVGCRFGETPITFEERRSGQSKLNKLEAARSAAIIVQLGLERVLARP
jgi:dolichol-phosphate mannosyltransferase